MVLYNGIIAPRPRPGKRRAKKLQNPDGAWKPRGHHPYKPRSPGASKYSVDLRHQDDNDNMDIEPNEYEYEDASDHDDNVSNSGSHGSKDKERGRRTRKDYDDYKDDHVDHVEEEDQVEEYDEDEDEDDGVVRCLCKNKKDYELMIQCEQCQIWQHTVCMGILDEDMIPDKYYCEECHPHDHPYIDSKPQSQVLKETQRTTRRSMGNSIVNNDSPGDKRQQPSTPRSEKSQSKTPRTKTKEEKKIDMSVDIHMSEANDVVAAMLGTPVKKSFTSRSSANRTADKVQDVFVSPSAPASNSGDIDDNIDPIRSPSKRGRGKGTKSARGKGRGGKRGRRNSIGHRGGAPSIAGQSEGSNSEILSNYNGETADTKSIIGENKMILNSLPTTVEVANDDIETKSNLSEIRMAYAGNMTPVKGSASETHTPANIPTDVLLGASYSRDGTRQNTPTVNHSRPPSVATVNSIDPIINNWSLLQQHNQHLDKTQLMATNEDGQPLYTSCEPTSCRINYPDPDSSISDFTRRAKQMLDWVGRVQSDYIRDQSRWNKALELYHERNGEPHPADIVSTRDSTAQHSPKGEKPTVTTSNTTNITNTVPFPKAPPSEASTEPLDPSEWPNDSAGDQNLLTLCESNGAIQVGQSQSQPSTPVLRATGLTKIAKEFGQSPGKKATSSPSQNNKRPTPIRNRASRAQTLSFPFAAVNNREDHGNSGSSGGDNKSAAAAPPPLLPGLNLTLPYTQFSTNTTTTTTIAVTTSSRNTSNGDHQDSELVTRSAPSSPGPERFNSFGHLNGNCGGGKTSNISATSFQLGKNLHRHMLLKQQQNCSNYHRRHTSNSSGGGGNNSNNNGNGIQRYKTGLGALKENESTDQPCSSKSPSYDKGKERTGVEQDDDDDGQEDVDEDCNNGSSTQDTLSMIESLVCRLIKFQETYAT
ncbi:Histone deacetylase complex subunit [Mycoemilia scoparia]|uniref:Histone deacetylase complex subunit n=1 Tax=Mycoemilia scoparia TaxID=417184 RepID=A0A9W8DK73_9FUNG|nr:Histone deacetylase complex subunit [Mycoemilia scoparia]